MLRALVQLTESDKRVLIALLLIIILLLIICWYIGFILIRVMKWQGKKIDTKVSDVVTTRVITDEKTFRKYAHKKNWQMFYKRAKIPVIILLLGSLTLLIYEMVVGFTYNPFSSTNGFGTLLFIWDFNDPNSYVTVFSWKILSKWPPLINRPHFVAEAWCGYIFVPCLIIGGIWYICSCTCLLSRFLRISKLSDSIFSKNLDSFNQNMQFAQQMSQAYNNQFPQQQNSTYQSNPNNKQNPPSSNDNGGTTYNL